MHRISPAEFGHGKTRNLGARMTRRPVIVFLVQDATPAGPEFLVELIEPLRSPNVAGVYGRQIAYNWTNRIEKLFMEQTYPEQTIERRASPSSRLRVRDIFFSNVCSAVRREVWERTPFDETLIMCEDQAWAKSALQQGFRIVYRASAAVYHSHNYGLPKVFRRNFDTGLSLKDVAGDSLADMVSYEIGHVAAGIRTLAATRDLGLVPHFFVHEAVRASGFLLGRRAHLLPRSVRRAFSLHRPYWDRHDEAQSELPERNGPRAASS
jgi:rhamnosyltransferase